MALMIPHLTVRPRCCQGRLLLPRVIRSPLDGPRHIWWNFVSSSRDRIEQAKADWRAGRMKLPDVDHDEFIPLPGDPPAANPTT